LNNLNNNGLLKFEYSVIC